MRQAKWVGELKVEVQQEWIRLGLCFSTYPYSLTLLLESSSI